MSCYTELPSDHAFTMFLATVDLDTVCLEQAARLSDTEWHVLARDRRVR